MIQIITGKEREKRQDLISRAMTQLTVGIDHHELGLSTQKDDLWVMKKTYELLKELEREM